MTKSKAEQGGYLKSREGVRGSRSAEIDALFAEFDRPLQPGFNLAVIKGGEVVHQRGYGVAEIEHDIPFTPQTVLRLGSTSKHLCAVTILLLEKEGLLSVKDEVRRHVPEMPDLGVLLTLDHLLTMTSGLPDWLNLPLFSGLREGTPLLRRDILEWLPRLNRLMFAPGATVSYSNTNYALLSLIIERVTSRSLGQVMSEKIFQPLEMTNTRLVPFISETVPGMAKGYLPGEQGKPVAGHMMAEISGDGAVNSTIEDMTRWFLAYRAGKALGIDLRADLEAETRLPNGSIADYRRGIVVSPVGGVTRIGHAGGMPGYLSEFAFYPELDLGIVMLTNWMDASLFERIDRIAEIASGRSFVPVEGSAEADPQFESALGLYVSTHSGLALSLVHDGNGRAVFFLGERSPLRSEGGGVYRFAKRGGQRRVRLLPNDGVELLDGALTQRFERCAGEPLRVANPERYVGDYVCPLIGERHQIRWDGNNLAVSTGSVMRPLVWSRLTRRRGEVFTAPIESEPSETNVTLRFDVDGAGQILGFEYNLNRIYGLKFERVRG